jgi:hypothetical protein
MLVMTHFEDRLSHARRHLLAKEFVPALRVADELLSIVPASLDALELRMLALMEVGRFELSCETARQMLRIDAGNLHAAETLNLLSASLATAAVDQPGGLA